LHVCTTNHPNLLILFVGVKESRTISHLSTTTLRTSCLYRQTSALQFVGLIELFFCNTVALKPRKRGFELHMSPVDESVHSLGSHAPFYIIFIQTFEFVSQVYIVSLWTIYSNLLPEQEILNSQCSICSRHSFQNLANCGVWHKLCPCLVWTDATVAVA
jgi:hypothetical protein